MMRGTSALASLGKISADDARMISRLRAGESEAWEEFVERYRKLIYSAIVRANSRFRAEWDETAMEEIFQEAVFKLLRRNGKALASWKGNCRLETWIYRIVRNVCIDVLRKRTRRRESDELPEEGESRAAARTLGGAGTQENTDLRISLEQAMQRSLSPKEALVVRLIYFEGFTYREVAERMDMSVGAMSGLVFRALAKLRTDGGVSRAWERVRA